MVATIALQEGMVLAEDVTNQGKTILKKGCTIDKLSIQKLQAFHIMGVSIMEPSDYAKTFFEKLRLSKEFKQFEKDYMANLVAYKVAVDSFIYKKVPFRTDDLLQICKNLIKNSMTDKFLLSYLYLLLPTEDNLTYAHGLNVALICNTFAKWLNLNEEDTKTLILCGFTFDIGKFILPQDIIWKPSKLNKMEFDLIKTHAFHGYHLLSKCSDLNDHIKMAALMHHERCDGTGYPQELKADQIDPFAKMIAILDVYEAMTSARSYREPLCPYKVISIFESDSFQKYDIKYIFCFLSHVANDLIGNRVSLNTGDEGVVIMNNQHNLSRPIIKMDDNSIVDLSKIRTLYITAVI